MPLTLQVSSQELTKDVLVHQQEVFSGRPNTVKMRAYHRNHIDVILSSTSPTWKLKKKSLLTSLKM